MLFVADATWELTSPATNREIEGFASATSVNTGDTIDLYVNTAAPTYTIKIFRMGYYGGSGAALAMGNVTRVGVSQTLPTPDATTGLSECTWTDPYTIDTTNWPTGVYLARLTASTGKQRFVHFVVRNDSSTAAFLLQCGVTTYQAYNTWNGTRSLYTVPTAAVKVSFDRPYDDGHPYNDGYGAGQFLHWEYPFIRFLEREGYDVSYSTDIDQHRSGTEVQQHAALLSVGHDEYWSKEMRANVEAARAAGVHLGFFGGNTCYWQIRLESNSSGTPYRTVVGYKSKASTEDPDRLDPDTYDQLTCRWRDTHVTLPGIPETRLCGVEYIYGKPQYLQDWKAYDVTTQAWVFAGTSMVKGSTIPAILGYECDSVVTGIPDSDPPAAVRALSSAHPGGALLGHTTFIYTTGATEVADATIYQDPSGAWVVGMGTVSWAWALDNYGLGNGLTDSYRVDVSADAQQITRNLLDVMAVPVPPPPIPPTITDPRDIPGCFLWMRSDLGATTSGGVMSQWDDQGTGAHNVASTSTSQPVYNTADANWDGVPSIVFDGSNDALTSVDAASTFTRFNDSTGFSVFALCRPDSTGSGTANHVICTSSNSSTIGFQINYNYTNQRFRVEMSNGSADVINISGAASSAPPDNNYALLFTYDPTATVKAKLYYGNTASGSLDTLQASQTSLSGTPSSSAPHDTLRVGSAPNLLTGAPFKGSVVEAALISPAVDSTYLQSLTAYVASTRGTGAGSGGGV